jgi:hypothetical protein
LTGVLMVVRLDAMKSASRPGSVMLVESVCRSSERSGESETTCWKFVRMFRSSASISRCCASAPVSGARLTRARRYGRALVTSSSRSRARPCTINRRLPSGSLNILWM